MGLFGNVKTTIICPKVYQSLNTLQNDSSPLGDMFKIMLKESGLTWNLKETPEETCDLEVSWEAMLKAYVIFTAVQISDTEVANDDDVNFLFKWCKDCLVNVPHIPVNDTDGSALKRLLKTNSSGKQTRRSKRCLNKTSREPGYQNGMSNDPPVGSLARGNLPKEEPNKENRTLDFRDAAKLTEVEIKREIDKTSEPDDSFDNNDDDANIDDDSSDTDNENEDLLDIFNDTYSGAESNEQSKSKSKPKYKTPAHVRARRRKLYTKTSRSYPKYREPPQHNFRRNKKYSSVYMQNKLTQRQVIIHHYFMYRCSFACCPPFVYNGQLSHNISCTG